MLRYIRPLLATLVAVQAAAAQQSEPVSPERSESAAEAVEWSFQAGVDVSNGDFGAVEDTTTLAVPVSVRADWGDFRFLASASWLQIEGPGGVVGDGVIIDGGGAGAVETNSGIGDLILGVNYDVPTSVTGDWFLQLQGRVKVPTADETRGLGTGETDVGLALDVARNFGRLTPFATVGYRFRGDPEGVDLNNTFNVSAGASYSLGGGYAVLASYDFRQATSETSDASQEIFGAVTGRFNPQWRWTLYSSAGLSDGAPDLGGGVQLTYRPGAR